LESKAREYVGHYREMEEGYDAVSFEFAIRELLNFVRGRGYLQATFGEPTKVVEGDGLVLTIVVNEGALYRLGEIRIEGAEAIASEKIKAMLGLRRGDIANAALLGEWLFEDLKKAYGELGFIEYTAEPEPKFRAATSNTNEGIVDFKVSIEEGRQFRVHTIKFQGNGFTDEELLRLCRIRAGHIFNQRLFEESIGELNKLGLFEFIDKDSDVDFKTDEEVGLIDIVVKLNIPGSELVTQQSSSNRRQP
jgi:outer membrane protein insertion porin family